MKRFGAACAFALAVIGWTAGCNDYGNTFQSPTGASLSSLAPANASSCVSSSSNPCPSLTLNLFGSGFVPKTVVQWNGKTIPTTVNLDSNNNVLGVTATVDASLLTKPGLAAVNTLNPHSGTTDNGLSNTLNFVINPPPNPLPTLNSPITPSSIGAGSTNISVTLAGQNFLLTAGTCPGTAPPVSTQSEVNWNFNGSQTSLTMFSSISSNQIQLVLPDSLLTTQGTALVTVRNPPACPTQTPSGISNPFNGGGGSSQAATFTINNDPPTHNSAPTSALAVAEETPALGSDGRFVAYTAAQSGHSQIFLRDTCTGASSDCRPHTTSLSAASDGTPGNADSNTPSMSSDGRFVAFSSAATNLAANTPAGRQIFLRDTCFGAASSCTPQTTLASVDDTGALSGSDNLLPSLSSSGRFVAFLSVTTSKYAANSGAANSGYRQIFVRDTCFGAPAACTPKTTRLSVMPGDTSSLQQTKPAGPAVSSSAQAVGISSALTPTMLTRTVPVDDRVFLALTNSTQR